MTADDHFLCFLFPSLFLLFPVVCSIITIFLNVLLMSALSAGTRGEREKDGEQEQRIRSVRVTRRPILLLTVLPAVLFAAGLDGFPSAYTMAYTTYTFAPVPLPIV